MYVCMYVIVWAAKTYSVPVQLAVADFCGQKGLIVSIYDSGTLSIHYLGEDHNLLGHIHYYKYRCFLFVGSQVRSLLCKR